VIGKLLTIKMTIILWGVSVKLDGTIHIAEGVETVGSRDRIES
jgi:hypothetical protein